jgi:hypothetical protein
MSKISAAWALTALHLAAGCGSPSLEGQWDGQVLCGEGGTVDMDMAITGDSSPYAATASLSGLYLNGAGAAIDMALDIRQPESSGPQVLGVEADCELLREGADAPETLECGGFNVLGWDGESRMQSRINGFLDTDYSCVLDLKRTG